MALFPSFPKLNFSLSTIQTCQPPFCSFHSLLLPSSTPYIFFFFTLYILMPSSVHLGVLTHPFSTNPPPLWMCIWARVHRFYVSMVREAAWLTGWRHQRERQDGLFFLFFMMKNKSCQWRQRNEKQKATMWENVILFQAEESGHIRLCHQLLNKPGIMHIFTAQLINIILFASIIGFWSCR